MNIFVGLGKGEGHTGEVTWAKSPEPAEHKGPWGECKTKVEEEVK